MGLETLKKLSAVTIIGNAAWIMIGALDKEDAYNVARWIAAR